MRHRRTRPSETSKPRPSPRDRRGKVRLPMGLTTLQKKMRTAMPMPALADAAAVPAPLLASYALRDGEAVLLVLRPSLWFIALSSLRWVAAGAALMGYAAYFGSHYRGGVFAGPFRGCAETGVAIMAGRLMWAALQWMGRLYVLTDLRLLTINGVLRTEVLDCPLRKVARTRLFRSPVDRAFGIGSIEIIPQHPDAPCALWHQIARPVQVHEQIVATLNRAKQGCIGNAE